MSRPIPPPTITAFSAQDGWRKGLATYATGKTFQFFVSPSGKARLYVWREDRRAPGSGVVYFGQRRMVPALRQALAARPSAGGDAWR